ncbi:MAG: HAD-IIA family hydrolase [Gordonia sp. (in: high G+C Gram-positive bacteria)]
MSARDSRPQSDDPGAPEIPDDVTAEDLDSDVRRDLKSLDKATADRVARHLVAAGDVLAEDPELALAHARAARARAARVGVVRETAGIAAYYAGEWQEAITELRAARRISGGGDSLLPLIADSERGLGRPEKAIELSKSPEARALSGDDAVELGFVVAGAHIDLGEPEAALATLSQFDLRPGRVGTEAARLFTAYAGALDAAGRRSEALTWYQTAAAADVDDATDAELQILEMLAEGVDLAAVKPADASSDQRDDVLAGYDALFFDLDGTLYEGSTVLPGAIPLVGESGLPSFFVTNNASRSPDAVSAHLRDLGFSASPEQVVTSAQVGAAHLGEVLATGSRVLVIGAQALRDAVAEQGLEPVTTADDEPVAVIQGHSPDTGWAQLSEAALAIRAGATWVATNTDTTLPTERGLLVGNGSMVAAVKSATGSTPTVTGKPAAPIMREALARSKSRRPLMIGDRLDTDIEAGNTVGIDSLLVLTGVSSARDLLAASESQRPTYVVPELRGVWASADDVRIGPKSVWQVTVLEERVSVNPKGDAVHLESMLPALTHAVWTADVGGLDLRITSDDPRTAGLLAGLGLR